MKRMKQTKTIIFTEAEREVFAKREFLSVAAWASKNLIVQDGIYRGSPLRLDVSPFLATPMDAFSTPGIREVVVCGSLQVGKTLFLYACLAWAMIYRLGIKMLTMPTKESRNRVVENKLKPLLSKSPALKKKLSRFKLDTILLNDGTSIELPTAESPSGRASITIQDLIVDEEDLYGSGGNSNPLEDFKGRTRSYGAFAKIARACQPKGGEESSIWRGITQDADQLYCYEVQCPAELCGHWHLMHMDNVVVPAKNPEDEKDPKNIRAHKLARYRCPRCKWLWTDHLRDRAVARGRWWPYRYIAERGFERIDNPAPNLLPENWGPGNLEKDGIHPPASVGFHLPAILSRMVSLSDLAARRIIAKTSEDPVVKRQYYNDDLAEPYTPVEFVTDDKRILTLRENWLPPQTVPNGAVALTCGIDVQKRGFWYLVKAWMPNMASYIIDYGSLETWTDVQKLVFDTYYPVLVPGGYPDWTPGSGMVPDDYLTGEVMPLWRVPMDSGGTETEGVFTRTEEVYMWVRGNGQGIVHACKGASHAQTIAVRPVVRERLPGTGRAIPGGLLLHMLDTGTIKTIAMSRLLNPESTQPCRLHAGCGQDLAEQLSAEHQIRKNNKLVWVAKRSMNHLLDCLMLADAAADASWTPSLPLYVLQLQQAAKRENDPPKQTAKKRNTTRRDISRRDITRRERPGQTRHHQSRWG